MRTTAIIEVNGKHLQIWANNHPPFSAGPTFSWSLILINEKNSMVSLLLKLIQLLSGTCRRKYVHEVLVNCLLRSAVAGHGRIYNLGANHTSNSGFDRTFMPCSGYLLCAAEQRARYQISWVNLQREAKLSVNM